MFFQPQINIDKQYVVFILGNSGSLINVDSISPKGTISKDSKLTITFTSTSQHKDSSLKAVVNVDRLKKKVGMGWIAAYVTIPDFVISTIGSIVERNAKGVKHLSGK